MSKKSATAFTLAALMILLIATFTIAHVDLGAFGVAVALLIATAKALLVVLYFMQIRHAPGLTRIAAGAGVFWLGILLTLSMSDYLSRFWLLLPGPWPLK